MLHAANTMQQVNMAHLAAIFNEHSPGVDSPPRHVDNGGMICKRTSFSHGDHTTCCTYRISKVLTGMQDYLMHKKPAPAITSRSPKLHDARGKLVNKDPAHFCLLHIPTSPVL